MAKKIAKPRPAPSKPAVKPAPKVKPKAARTKLKPGPSVPAAPPAGDGPAVLDRLWSVIMERRSADPAASHSARLLSRGIAKVAQKFGEEAVECLIEAVAGNAELVVAESADVLYHLLVMWVAAGVKPGLVWAELARREGISGVTEKASRVPILYPGQGTRKIP